MEEETLPTLQPDALIHIFHKLPILSLLQCKLVCKEWTSLISDPFFKSTYNSSTIPNHPISLMMIPRWGCRKRAKSSMRYEIDGLNNTLVSRSQALPRNIPSEDHGFTIMGSWNGLVALYHGSGDFYLINPFTKEEISVCASLDPDKFMHKHVNGLSYDPSSREYKVVLSGVEENIINLCVVNFKHGGWSVKSQSSQIDGFTRGSRTTPGIVVNGVPHWIVSPTSVEQLCYFDHRKEEFREIRKPKEWDTKRLCMLGVVDGNLAASLYSKEYGLEVWVLRNFSNPESWSSMFVIAKNIPCCVSPLCRMNDEEVLMDANKVVLLIYNYRSHTIRQPEPKMMRTQYNMISYFPSFVSPTN